MLLILVKQRNKSKPLPFESILTWSSPNPLLCKRREEILYASMMIIPSIPHFVHRLSDKTSST